MSVYVVTSCPLHGVTTIEGVFSTHEKAEAFVRGFHESYNMDIEERALDGSVPPGKEAMTEKTVTFTNPDDVADFEVGERVSIDDFRYETACAILGKPLVDSYREWKANPPQAPCGVVTVVGVDRGTGVITFGAPRSTSAPTTTKGTP